MNVMLLAAGEGTRLRPHTNKLPKPAIPFLNVPLGFYSLAFLENLKVDRLVVNTYHLPHLVQQLFTQAEHRAESLSFSAEGTLLLGSGGGLKHAEKYFDDDDIILMNADEVILPKVSGQLARAIEQHKKTKSICTLLTIEHPEVGQKFGGVWLDQEQKVIGFGKKAPPEAKKGLHFIGVQILSKKIFSYLPAGVSNILYDGVTAALAAGETVSTFSVDCLWFETGNEVDFISATGDALKILALGKDAIAQYLTRVIHRFSPNSHFSIISNRLILSDQSAKIGDIGHILGWLVASPNSVVGEHCHLRNVVLGPSQHLAPGTQAENQLII